MSKHKLVKFKYDDGGRAKAGFKGTTGDCAVRALAIAMKKSYAETYEWLNQCAFADRCHHTPRCYSHAGTVLRHFYRALRRRGWVYNEVVEGKVGLDDLPMGRLIVRVQLKGSRSYHCTALINGVLHDHGDWQKKGYRVLGWFKKSRSSRTRRLELRNRRLV